MIINMNGAKAPETPSPVLQEKTVTPQTLPTVIGADEGYDGLSQVTINPDSQLKAENIRSGKTIFGVGGSFVGEPYPVADEEAQFFYDVMTKAPSATPPTHPIRATQMRGEQQFMGTTINAGTLDFTNMTFTKSYRLFGWSELACELILPKFKSEGQIFTNANLAWFPKGEVDYSNATDGFSSCWITHGDITFTPSMLPTGKLPAYFLANLNRRGSDPLNITIPENITDMSGTNCIAVSRPFDFTINIIMKPTTPPTLANNSFKTASTYESNTTITVPKGSLEAYQTAQYWSDLASIMVEANE